MITIGLHYFWLSYTEVNYVFTITFHLMLRYDNGSNACCTVCCLLNTHYMRDQHTGLSRGTMTDKSTRRRENMVMNLTLVQSNLHTANSDSD